MITYLLLLAVAVCNAAPYSKAGVRRQDELPTSLYGNPLSYSQIMDLIKEHTGGKRQTLSLFGDPLTHSQIIDLIREHTNSRRQAQHAVLNHFLHSVSTTNDDARFFTWNPDPLGTLLTVAQQNDQTLTQYLSDLSYNEILHLLGELMKGH
ncbi:unnamed protein product [Lymnaea stagnalis]|uniref:Uncharacterized protein n=1 Tax=Lymnaea stagnalis TaxID=6523 RepID=A0AAV2IKB6_LYMST